MRFYVTKSHVVSIRLDTSSLRLVVVLVTKPAVLKAQAKEVGFKEEPILMEATYI